MKKEKNLKKITLTVQMLTSGNSCRDEAIKAEILGLQGKQVK